MKNLILIFVLAFISTSGTFAQQSNIDKDLQMYIQLWDNITNKGQIDLINDKYFDAEITIPLEPEAVVGIDAFKEYHQNYLSGFSNISFTITHAFGHGDNIVKHWNFKGTHTGNFFGIPATGKQVDIDGVTLVKMKNGKIAREQDFVDNMTFLKQIGLVSDPNNIKVIDNLYKAFAEGDIPKVLEGMDPEIIWNEAEGNIYAKGNPYIGPEAILNGVFARIGAEHEYFNLQDVKLHEMNNNQILATLRYNAKVKQNGESYNAQAAHLWTLKNGKISAFQQYADTKQLNEALTAPYYATSNSKLYDLDSFSPEIEFMLKSSNVTIDEGDNLTVFFSISKDKKIQHVKVASEDKKIAILIAKKLKNRQLDGGKWREGKIYEHCVSYSPEDFVLYCGRNF